MYSNFITCVIELERENTKLREMLYIQESSYNERVYNFWSDEEKVISPNGSTTFELIEQGEEGIAIELGPEGN